METKVYNLGIVDDRALKFAVIVSKYKGKYVYGKHKKRDTWEVPGGHREENEAIDDTAARELKEETGAIRFNIKPVCDYLCDYSNDDKNADSNYGRVYYAEITELGSLPDLEIGKIELFDEMPDNLTYPQIQPILLNEVEKRINKDEITDVEVLEKAKDFLLSHLKIENCIYETVEKTHSWRKGSKNIVLHSFRVYSYAEKIIEGENLNLTQEETLLIKTSILLHDIGKFYVDEKHAEKSAEIANKWLHENCQVADKIKDTDRLVNIIKNHSAKDEFDNDLCSIILKDADLLDEIGAMSIFMCSNQVDKSSPYFFNELLNRLQNFELKYCDKIMGMLKTEVAKNILKGKKDFIESFIKQLKSELEGTEEIGL